MATPLEIVGHNLVVHSGIAVADVPELVSMMGIGIGDTLKDDDGPDFARRLVNSLDVGAAGRAPFGLKYAEFAERLAVEALDPAVHDKVHAGNLATLAAMSLANTFESGPPPGMSARQIRGAQAVGTVGLEQMWRVFHESFDPSARNFAGSIISLHGTADPELLAIELLGLEQGVSEYLVDPLDEDPVFFTSRDVGQKIFGDKIEVPTADMTLRSEALERMDWLDLSKAKTLDVHEIVADSTVKAYVADLTGFHPQLEETMRDLRADERAYKVFCSRLAFGVINHLINPARRRLPAAFHKLPTYVIANGSSVASSELVRGYYVSLGEKGGLPLFGLIAGARTKERQAKVLSIIGGKKLSSIRL